MNEREIEVVRLLSARTQHAQLMQQCRTNLWVFWDCCYPWSLSLMVSILEIKN